MNVSASVSGRPPFSTIRLGHDGTVNCILLGTTSTAWQYPKVVIAEVLTGHSNYGNWGTGWTMSVIGSEAGIGSIVTPSIDSRFDSSGHLSLAGNLNVSGTITGSLSGNATTAGGLAVHAGVNNEANKIVRTDVSGYIYAGWINTISGDNGTTAISRVYASSDGFIRYYTLDNFSSQVRGLSTVASTTADYPVSQLVRWKNYGGGHVIFDASAGTSPTGSAVNNTNPAVAWAASYPTLMGWNGSTTYGVRVDRANLADTATTANALGGVAAANFLRKDTSDTSAGVITALGFGSTGVSGDSNANPGIYNWGYQEDGAWSYPYPDLILGYHTGVKIGGYTAYGGTRFYADHPNNGTPAELFSVGNGDNHVRVANTLITAGETWFGTGGSYKVTNAGVGTFATSNFGGLMPAGGDASGAIGLSSQRWLTARAVNFYGVMNVGPDLAERYPASEPVEPGDVVLFDPNAPKHTTVLDQSKVVRINEVGGKPIPVAVKKSSVPYQPGLLGVISTAPGVQLHDPQDDKNPPVALIGRVPVKVCNENGPIKVGDRLTSSSRPGYAMRATGAGPAIAIALQAFDGKEGKILAFVQAGEANVTERLKEMSDDIAELRAELKALKEAR